MMLPLRISTSIRSLLRRRSVGRSRHGLDSHILLRPAVMPVRARRYPKWKDRP